MRAKIIALCLQQVCGKALLSIAVNVSKRIADGRNRVAQIGSSAHDLSQTIASFVDEVAEKGIEHQVLQVRFGLECGANGIEQFGADNATTFPDSRHLVK